MLRIQDMKKSIVAQFEKELSVFKESIMTTISMLHKS